jgi:septal ring factor EnvC (AmiA/AmiB activator)
VHSKVLKKTMRDLRHMDSGTSAVRRGPSRLPLSMLLLSASVAAVLVSPCSAQTTTPAQQAAAPVDVIRQREQELEAARAQQKSAAELQQKLKADIAALGQDRSKLTQQVKPGCVRSMRESSRFAVRSMRAVPKSLKSCPRCNAPAVARRLLYWCGRKTR